MKVEMIYLSQEDVIRCGGMSMDKAIDDLEEVFRLYDKGDYILPGKIVMKRPEPNAEETTGRINAMPGYIGGRFNMPGIKWDRQRSAGSVQVRPAARLGRDRAERSRDQGTHCHHGRHTHQYDPHRRSNGRLRQVYGALALEDRRPLRRGDRRARLPVCQGKRHRPEAQALGRAHHGVIDPNLIGTTSLYQPFGQVSFLAGLSAFFRGRAAGEMHLQREFCLYRGRFREYNGCR